MNRIGTSLVNRMRLRLNRWFEAGSANGQLTMANCQSAIDGDQGRFRGARREFVWGTLALAWCVCLLATGCAVHYFDKQTGTEHLWGFGHLKMKAAPSNEGVQAVVKGTEVLGFNLSAGQEDYHIGLGWDYRRRIVISSNTAVRLEWPNGDFFNVRVGTVPPFATNSLPNKTKPNP